MDAIRVAVVNWAHLDDQDVISGVTALQRQLREDFGPVWQIDAELVLVPRSLAHTHWPGYWGLVLLDTRLEEEQSDEGNALSIYGRLTSDGHPLARVLIDREQDWTHLASHELLEMLVDPDGNGAVNRDSDAPPFRVLAKRVCDPCAAYSDGYEHAGRQVSDFVYPAWFGSALSGGGNRFDKQDRIGGPFELLAGGSIGVFDPSTSTWQVLDSNGKPLTLSGAESFAHEAFAPSRVGWAP